MKLDLCQYNLPAAKIVKKIRALSKISAQLDNHHKKIKSRYILFCFLALLPAVAAFKFGETSAALFGFVAIGIFGCIIVGILQAIHDVKLIGKGAMYIFIGVVLSIILAVIIFPDSNFFSYTHQEFFSCGLASLFLPTVSAYISLHIRCKYIGIQEFEARWLKDILEPLLSELPRKLKCHVEYNPFPAMWSMQATKDDWKCDTLLSLLTAPESNAVLGIHIAHHQKPKISRRGKHKGYRNRMVCSFTYKHPVLAAIDPSQRDRITHKLNSRIQSLSSKKIGDEFTLTPKWSKKITDKKVSVRISYKYVSFRSDLKGNQLLSAQTTLDLVHTISQLVSECEAPDTAIGA